MNLIKQTLLNCQEYYGSPAIKAFIAYAEDKIQEWKDELVDAKLEQVPIIQGKIKGLEDILNEIKPKPIRTESRDGAYFA